MKNKMMILTTLGCLCPIFIGLALYPQLPEQIITHWNSQGVADGYMNKQIAVWFPSVMIASVNLLVYAMFSLDPKRKNMSQKIKSLTGLMLMLTSFFVSCMSYAASLSIRISVNSWMYGLMAFIFIAIGNYLPKCKQNYTMGIRLPWTLNDEENWNQTHHFAGFTWVLGGFVMLSSIFVPVGILQTSLRILCFILLLCPLLFSLVFYLKKQKNQR